MHHATMSMQQCSSSGLTDKYSYPLLPAAVSYQQYYNRNSGSTMLT